MCDIAERELTKVDTAGLALPGDFNVSASTLFGGSHAGLFTGDRDWAHDMQQGTGSTKIGICDEEARIKFSTGIAALGTDEQQDLLGATNLKILEKESTGLEVTAIIPSDEITREVYATQREIVRNKIAHLEPLGKLVCKVWHAGDCDEWDLPKNKYPDGTPHKIDDKRTFQFWVEEHVLSDCFVGMKVDVGIVTLEGDITILDEVKETHCSFYMWLPNELWMENKPKEVRWLAKGLPDDEEVEINGVKEGGQAKAQEDDEFDDE